MTIFKLRSWKEEDAESIVAFANNPAITGSMRNSFPNPFTLECAISFIKDCISKEGKLQITHAIEVDGKAVGSIAVFVKDDIYEKSAEIGYWLAEEYWRKGIMSGAVKQICKEAFEKFPLERILAQSQILWDLGFRS